MYSAFSVTKFGQPLDPNLYSWNHESGIFSTDENHLVLDFSGYNNVIFKTGFECTFKTGFGCTFQTGFGCTFNTGDCCIFDTYSNCTFNTGNNCTFNTRDNCTFNTLYSCTFNVYWSCKFKVGKECSITRRDVFEVIIPPEDKFIQLNGYQIPGYLTEEDIIMKEIIE